MWFPLDLGFNHCGCLSSCMKKCGIYCGASPHFVWGAYMQWNTFKSKKKVVFFYFLIWLLKAEQRWCKWFLIPCCLEIFFIIFFQTFHRFWCLLISLLFSKLFSLLSRIFVNWCSSVERGFKGKLSPRLVKMVLSATLTQDPSKLAHLDLHHPLFLTTGEQRYQLPKQLQSFKVVWTHSSSALDCPCSVVVFDVLFVKYPIS